MVFCGLAGGAFGHGLGVTAKYFGLGDISTIIIVVIGAAGLAWVIMRW
jgi:hypothetical protein